MKSPQERRLRGGTKSELTKFKRLWRDALGESEKDFWRSRWLSADTQAQVRAEIWERLGINLSYDDQLKEMRDYDWTQRQMDLEAERAREEERRTLEEHPDWTAEHVRDDLLERLVRRARAQGDAKLGLAAVKVDLQARLVTLDARRIALLEKKAAAYDQVKQAAGTGGLTPETFAKIERELKLL